MKTKGVRGRMVGKRYEGLALEEVSDYFSFLVSKATRLLCVTFGSPNMSYAFQKCLNSVQRGIKNDFSLFSMIVLYR